MYAILVDNYKAIYAEGRKNVGMADRVLDHLQMHRTKENRRWVLANLAEVTNSNGWNIDFGYYQNVPIVAVV